jgi:hypothetical protein
LPKEAANRVAFSFSNHNCMPLTVAITSITIATLKYVIGPAIVEWLKGRRINKSVKARIKTS